ncbi:MAG: hypothetical protein K2X00_18805 [Nitrospiraceae bacterium]|nr:hypothetical protein [Nitrospiraceae bacterium]
MRILTNALRLGLMALILLVGSSDKANAQCSIGWNANPVVGYSTDIYLGFIGYTGSNRAVIQQQGISTAFNCVQLGGAWYSFYPLSLVQILPPVVTGGLFYSNYIYQDNQFHPVPYYPYVSGAVTTIYGVDVTSGVPFQGTGSVNLWVFALRF